MKHHCQIYRWDRNKHGGGGAIYVHISKVVLEGGPHNLEFLSLSVLSIHVLYLPVLLFSITSRVYF